MPDYATLARPFAACLMILLSANAISAEEPEAEEPPKPVGFELGAFVMRDYQPLQDITTRMVFTAHASVLEEDATRFAKLLESRKGRVRDQVLTAARLATTEELQDPDLVLLRRRVLLRLRHSLPELKIQEVFLSEFQLFVD